ncbi:hypothetical protein AcV7_005606 [Taiwanofungus camphoratus]|nr:hypothetical protein AcV7_005606 [Antrodia cinnamomea]
MARLDCPELLHLTGLTVSSYYYLTVCPSGDCLSLILTLMRIPLYILTSLLSTRHFQQRLPAVGLEFEFVLDDWQVSTSVSNARVHINTRHSLLLLAMETDPLH